MLPRKRKYDYDDDFPVTFIVKVPVKLMNILEDDLHLNKEQITKIIVEYLKKYIENNYKNS